MDTKSTLILGLLLLACTAGTVAAGVFLYRRMLRFQWRKTRELAELHHSLSAELSELVWTASIIRQFVPPAAILPKPGIWSLDSAGLQLVAGLVDERRPRLAVELGSGLSSIVIGFRLRALGTGRLVSLEHDRHYAAVTRNYLRLNGLEDIVEVRDAPLVASPEHPDSWYDTAALRDLSDVDFLLIDGPPMPVAARVREPALDVFRDRLAPGWVAVLDDAERPGEQAILEAWASRHHIATSVEFDKKKMAIMRASN